MRENHHPTDPETRVSRVIDYIHNHPGQDLSRRTLSEVAHYSTEHLPKLFKNIVGETPKQYSLQLRLETAFHHLIIHPQKSIQEIAFDSGFAALSVFSRAIKNYFNNSPEQIRRLSHTQQMRLLHKATPSPSPFGSKTQPVPEVSIVRQSSIIGVFILAPFNNPDKITAAFQTLQQTRLSPTVFHGILTPHLRNTYRAFLPVSSNESDHHPFLTGQIKGGTYARFSLSGDLRATNKAAHYFYRRWLPASGYKIAGIAGFETFTENPAVTPYYQLQRHIHIPVEPNS